MKSDWKADREYWYAEWEKMQAGRDKLWAEVVRLRKERDAAQADLNQAERECDLMLISWENMRAERDEARAEAERLREALQRLADAETELGYALPDTATERRMEERVYEATVAARAALAGEVER